MTDLQTAFYIVALVYMGLMFLIMLALLTTALVIRSKVKKMKQAIDKKIDKAKFMADKAGVAWRTMRYFVKR